MLKTVVVPKKLEPIFKKAEEIVNRFFKSKKVDVSKGTIEISDERYLLIRASSLSIDFFKCVMDIFNHNNKKEGLQTTRQLLFDISHAIGMKDAEHFQKEMKLIDPIDKLSAGPVHFAYTGWASVIIHPKSHPSSDDKFLLFYDHPNSFEAEAWMKAKETTEIPVCIMNAGYSSGWCEQSFGIPLVATEISCRARGDKACSFVMAPPSKIEAHIKEQIKKNPNLASQSQRVEIPDFFKLKKIEGELRASNLKLIDSNNQLRLRTKEIELLSKFGEALPKCTTKDEIYSVLYTYVSKLFPNCTAKLLVFTKNNTRLPTAIKDDSSSGFIEHCVNPIDCLSLGKNELYVVQPSSKKPRCSHITSKKGGYICAPITTDGEVFGLLTISFGENEFRLDKQSIVSRISGDVAMALINLKLRETLHELSIRDYLTDLYNRRYMEEMLFKEISRASRHNSHIGLIMFDIDYFKKYNDTYGHDAGDSILIELGKFLKSFFREGDIICRFGGEEFLIILPGMTLEQTQKRAESLRKSVQEIRVTTKDKILESVSISAGVSLFPDHGKNVRELLNSVDDALYQAKEKGRNRVCLAR